MAVFITTIPVEITLDPPIEPADSAVPAEVLEAADAAAEVLAAEADAAAVPDEDN